MSFDLMLVASLLAPCQITVPVSEPCSGLLWPIDKSRAAVKCSKVELPLCESKAATAAKEAAAKLQGCEEKVALARELARVVPPKAVKPDGWHGGYVVSAGLAGALAGIVSGVLLTR